MEFEKLPSWSKYDVATRLCSLKNYGYKNICIEKGSISAPESPFRFIRLQFFSIKLLDL
jgi:hypothetical protein